MENLYKKTKKIKRINQCRTTKVRLIKKIVRYYPGNATKGQKGFRTTTFGHGNFIEMINGVAIENAKGNTQVKDIVNKAGGLTGWIIAWGTCLASLIANSTIVGKEYKKEITTVSLGLTIAKNIFTIYKQAPKSLFGWIGTTASVVYYSYKLIGACEVPFIKNMREQWIQKPIKYLVNTGKDLVLAYGTKMIQKMFAEQIKVIENTKYQITQYMDEAKYTLKYMWSYGTMRNISRGLGGTSGVYLINETSNGFIVKGQNGLYAISKENYKILIEKTQEVPTFWLEEHLDEIFNAIGNKIPENVAILINKITKEATNVENIEKILENEGINVNFFSKEIPQNYFEGMNTDPFAYLDSILESAPDIIQPDLLGSFIGGIIYTGIAIGTIWFIFLMYSQITKQDVYIPGWWLIKKPLNWANSIFWGYIEKLSWVMEWWNGNETITESSNEKFNYKAEDVTDNKDNVFAANKEVIGEVFESESSSDAKEVIDINNIFIDNEQSKEK